MPSFPYLWLLGYDLVESQTKKERKTRTVFGSKIFSDMKRDINLIIYVIEFSADEFSAKLGYANLLRSGLIKLSKDNLSLPIDDWLYSAINHSHPPIPERIDALKRYE